MKIVIGSEAQFGRVMDVVKEEMQKVDGGAAC